MSKLDAALRAVPEDVAQAVQTLVGGAHAVVLSDAQISPEQLKALANGEPVKVVAVTI